jgi:LysM repeat protein
MKRYYSFAMIALFSIVAMGCTREKPDSAPAPNLPSIAPEPTSASLVPPSTPTRNAAVPAAGITNPTGTIISNTPIVLAPVTIPPSGIISPTATFVLPPGAFSQLPPINAPTSSASAIGGTPTPPASSISGTVGASTPPATSIGPTTYTVQWGDWLSKISRQFGTTNEAIMAANPRMNPNLLIPGQLVNIPGPGGTLPPTPSAPGIQPANNSGPTTYTVQRGDWFYAIARKFNVTVEMLQAANPGVNPNFVFPGQVLNVPGSSGFPANPAGNATYTPATGGLSPTPFSTGTSGDVAARYTVQPGDTLSAIAARFGTTIYSLQIANHLPGPSFIYPGQVLIIPK